MSKLESLPPTQILQIRVISLMATLILATLATTSISCSTASRATTNRRIEQNGTLFHQKSLTEKKAITNGNITPGMTRDAVYMAWGNPRQRLEGVADGVPYEEWIYDKFKPKANLDIGISNGPGLGIKKETVKTVRFINGRVSDFRRKL